MQRFWTVWSAGVDHNQTTEIKKVAILDETEIDEQIFDDLYTHNKK